MGIAGSSGFLGERRHLSGDQIHMTTNASSSDGESACRRDSADAQLTGEGLRSPTGPGSDTIRGLGRAARRDDSHAPRTEGPAPLDQARDRLIIIEPADAEGLLAFPPETARGATMDGAPADGAREPTPSGWSVLALPPSGTTPPVSPAISLEGMPSVPSDVTAAGGRSLTFVASTPHAEPIPSASARAVIPLPVPHARRPHHRARYRRSAAAHLIRWWSAVQRRVVLWVAPFLLATAARAVTATCAVRSLAPLLVHRCAAAIWRLSAWTRASRGAWRSSPTGPGSGPVRGLARAAPSDASQVPRTERRPMASASARAVIPLPVPHARRPYHRARYGRTAAAHLIRWWSAVQRRVVLWIAPFLLATAARAVTATCAVRSLAPLLVHRCAAAIWRPGAWTRASRGAWRSAGKIAARIPDLRPGVWHVSNPGAGARIGGTAALLLFGCGIAVGAVSMLLLTLPRIQNATIVTPSVAPISVEAGTVESASQPAPEARRPVEPLSFRGSLEVRSSPAGAQVFVNGTRVGITPVVLDGIPVGVRAVRAALNGHEPWSATVTVVANQRAVANAVMRRLPAQ